MLIRKFILAGMFALLALAGGVQAGGNAERGAKLVEDCVSCHGHDGKGNFETPAIAGLEEAYIYQQLKDFSSGKRASMDGIMHLYTVERNDRDKSDLAAYWSSRKPEELDP
ncbi:MAG: c-type cytochrome [Proteobacteria bacterium]|nr:c-type cytochrome [Pseudomonadota bacterium]